jgi:hypothetical protein
VAWFVAVAVAVAVADHDYDHVSVLDRVVFPERRAAPGAEHVVGAG